MAHTNVSNYAITLHFMYHCMTDNQTFTISLYCVGNPLYVFGPYLINPQNNYIFLCAAPTNIAAIFDGIECLVQELSLYILAGEEQFFINFSVHTDPTLPTLEVMQIFNNLSQTEP